MLPYAVNGFSICGLPSYVQSMAPLYAVLLPSGNAFRSTSLSFLPQWATLSNQCNSASKLKSTNPGNLNLKLASKSNAFSMWATPSNPNLNSASKSPFSIRQLFSIPFGLQVQSQLGLQMQSQLCNVFFFSNRQIIPQWNFSLKSSQPSKSALATAELSNRGISPLNSSQPSNSTTLSADFTNLRSILQFLR